MSEKRKKIKFNYILEGFRDGERERGYVSGKQKKSKIRKRKR
jgi:hypothetical protein